MQRSFRSQIGELIRRPLRFNDIAALLEHFPAAALIVDLNDRIILACNTQAIKLSAYTREELQNAALSSLFPYFEDLANRELDKVETTLIQRSGLQNRVQITYAPINGESQLGFLSFQISQTQPDNEIESELAAQRLQATKTLSQAWQSRDIKTATKKILQAGQLLTGSSFLAIYRTGEEKEYKLNAYTKGEHYLPARITDKELSHLKIPFLWEMGDKTLSILHQTALTYKAKYIATAPIDQANYFLVISNYTTAPPNDILNLIEVITASLEALFKQERIFSNFENKLAILNQSVAVNQALKKTVNDGIIFVSPSLTITELNLVAEETLGYPTAEVKGRQIGDVLVGTQKIYRKLTELKDGNATSANLGDVTLHHRNGQSLLVNIRAIPIITNGNAESIAIILSDLSKVEAYKQLNKQLEQRAWLGEVASIFAHEVRNPINNISTGLQVMSLNFEKDDPIQHEFKRLRSDISRIEELVKSTLSFSKSREFNFAPINIEELIVSLLERRKRRIIQHNIKVHLKTDKDLQKIKGDWVALEQVFTNLIENAIQAMQDSGGALGVLIQRSRTTGYLNQIEIHISDTGKGIPDEILDKIFKPFFTTKSEGTGLGLAVTQQIVAAHNGQINVESFPGGTVFKLRLPTFE